MQRKTSPILHDYQVTATRSETHTAGGGLPWFAVGLGLPLIIVGFLLFRGGDTASASADPAAATVADRTQPPVTDTVAAGTQLASVAVVATTPEDTLRADTDTGVTRDYDSAVIDSRVANRGDSDYGMAATDSRKADVGAAVTSIATRGSAEQLSAADAMLANLLAMPEPAPTATKDIVLEISQGDTLDGLFRKNNLNIGDLITISQLDAAKTPLRMLKPGDRLTVTHNSEGRVYGITRDLGIEERLTITKGDDGFVAQVVQRPVEYRRVVKHGNIDSSLFESAMAVGLSDRVVMNVAGIFAWDIDFVYDIRQGDSYYVIFEEIWQDGKKIEDGEIVAAEFVNQGDSYKAVRFRNPDGTSDYFDAEGRSVRKAFLRAPVDFKRISSSFNPNRRHPVLNTIRAHRGVDYAAPRGTPIMSAGDGKIIFRGKQRGYGNVIKVQHGGNITTLYAHMSNFHKGQRVGTRVRQGQIIGFVGATGMVTGAHLHYEYQLNGVHRNPRTVPLPQAEPIKAEYREDFERESAPLLDELDQYKQRVQLAAINDDNRTTL
ncbi:MAG: peptidoglycan DD-metalloendopeptidase family protein [Pseudomonadota bacterium]